MSITPKNWAKFQHFKDRKPPWIKLYRDLLDDIEWHELDGELAKTLVMIWLIASEDIKGILPNLKQLAFRLRINENTLKQRLTKLDSWLIQDDIKVISDRYQDDAPETETETEREKEKDSPFSFFWKHYPSKVGKRKALAKWKELKPDIETVLKALSWQVESDQWKNGYIPNPSTYLNEGRWEDEPPPHDVIVVLEDWRTTKEGITKKGIELAVPQKPNEDIKDYRKRLIDVINTTH